MVTPVLKFYGNMHYFVVMVLFLLFVGLIRTWCGILFSFFIALMLECGFRVADGAVSGGVYFLHRSLLECGPCIAGGSVSGGSLAQVCLFQGSSLSGLALLAAPGGVEQRSSHATRWSSMTSSPPVAFCFSWFSCCRLYALLLRRYLQLFFFYGDMFLCLLLSASCSSSAAICAASW